MTLSHRATESYALEEVIFFPVCPPDRGATALLPSPQYAEPCPAARFLIEYLDLEELS
jgi:hypothetical protein